MTCLAVAPAGSEARCAPLGTERLGIGIAGMQRWRSGGAARHRQQRRGATTQRHEAGCDSSRRQAHKQVVSWREGEGDSSVQWRESQRRRQRVCGRGGDWGRRTRQVGLRETTVSDRRVG
jgi:hypothetical protein